MKKGLRSTTVVIGLLVPVFIIAGCAYLSAGPATASSLIPFSSYGEFAAFLDRTGHYSGGSDVGMLSDSRFVAFQTAEGAVSGTNVQVAGVDELDIVKTDGTYVYAASGDQVLIIRAIPADQMRVVGKIDAREATGGRLSTAWISGLFVAEGHVVVVASGWEATVQPFERPIEATAFWYPSVGLTYIAAFDISEPRAPELVWSHGVSGTPSTARLMDGYVYVVIVDWIQRSEGAFLAPMRCMSERCAAMPLGSIWYDPQSSEAGTVTHIVAVRVGDGTSEMMSIMGGATSSVYMSRTSLYLTVVKWQNLIPEEATVWTTIHKVSVDGLDLRPAASGDVPGTLLSQWAMDEWEVHLRVATTVGWRGTTSGVYVLDEDLSPVGALEGIAPTERIFAARYLGDTLYLVTFRRIDPLFVIDLSDPRNPHVVGELKVPGFSAYLHPYGDGLLVGIGQEDGAVKVSLFDVSDPGQPMERDTWLAPPLSWSPSLSDHKAVLANPASGLLVLPVDAWSWEPEGHESVSGAYVFQVAAGNIALRGVALHAEGGVQRSLYIGDVLYTLSGNRIVASSLSNLAELGALPLVAP